MKILPVNSTNNYYSNFKAQPQQSGLWGKSEHKVRKVFDIVYEKWEKHLHPFLDTKASDLHTVIEEHEAVREGIGKYSVEKVFVDMRLPITKAEWEKYITNKTSMSKKDRTFIEQFVKNNELTLQP